MSQGAEMAGMGFLGKGQPTPSHQVGGLGERCKLFQRGSPATKGFSSYILVAPDGLSWNFLGSKFGGGVWTPWPPKSAYD